MAIDMIFTPDIKTTSATLYNGRAPIYFDVDYFIDADGKIELHSVELSDGGCDNIATFLKPEVCNEIKLQIAVELRKRADNDWPSSSEARGE